MHPPKGSLGVEYNIVHWTSLIKNQDVNSRNPGPIRHFRWFQDGRHEKRQNAYILLYQPPTVCYAYFYEPTIYI